MSVFAISVLAILGLCIVGAVSAWALHWHFSSRAARRYGRHTRHHVLGQVQS